MDRMKVPLRMEAGERLQERVEHTQQEENTLRPFGMEVRGMMEQMEAVTKPKDDSLMAEQGDRPLQEVHIPLALAFPQLEMGRKRLPPLVLPRDESLDREIPGPDTPREPGFSAQNPLDERLLPHEQASSVCLWVGREQEDTMRELGRTLEGLVEVEVL